LAALVYSGVLGVHHSTAGGRLSRVGQAWSSGLLETHANTLSRHNFLARPKSCPATASAQGGPQFGKIKPAGFQLFVDFRLRINPGMLAGDEQQ
jgi:hypothetical protein